MKGGGSCSTYGIYNIPFPQQNAVKCFLSIFKAYKTWKIWSYPYISESLLQFPFWVDISWFSRSKESTFIFASSYWWWHIKGGKWFDQSWVDLAKHRTVGLPVLTETSRCGTNLLCIIFSSLCWNNCESFKHLRYK